MTIKQLQKAVSKIEGGKRNLSIAQISEVLRCINDISEREFYAWVRRGFR